MVGTVLHVPIHTPAKNKNNYEPLRYPSISIISCVCKT